MSDARKNIDDINRTLTALVGTERLVGRDGTGDFKILASVLAQLAVSDFPIGAVLPFNGITTPSSYLLCDGSAISRTTYASMFGIMTSDKGSFTVTIATPAVFTLTGHGLETEDCVELTTTGTLPTGLGPNVNYYVIKIDANTFNLATSRANAVAGTKIATSGSQSGVHSLRYAPFGISTSANFLLPDLRGAYLRGSGTHGTEQMADGNYFEGGRLGVPEDDAMQRITGLADTVYAANANVSGVFSKTIHPTVANRGTGTAPTYNVGFDSANSTSPNNARTDDAETRVFNIPTKYIIKYE